MADPQSKAQVVAPAEVVNGIQLNTADQKKETTAFQSSASKKKFKTTEEDNGLSSRFFIAIRGGYAFVKPQGVSEMLGDANRTLYGGQFDFMFGYHFHSRGSVALSMGRERWSYKNKPDDKGWNGFYAGGGYPVFFIYGLDLVDTGVGSRSRGVEAVTRFRLQLNAGAGFLWGTEIQGKNEFNEELQTSKMTIPGGTAALSMFLGKARFPVNLEISGGYRYYPQVSLGTSGYINKLSHPFGIVGIHYVF